MVLVIEAILHGISRTVAIRGGEMLTGTEGSRRTIEGRRCSRNPETVPGRVGQSEAPERTGRREVVRLRPRCGVGQSRKRGGA